MRKILVGLFAVVLLPSMQVLARDYGSAVEARAMIERVAGALRTDADLALARFNAGGPGFRDRDLYPFCATTDGTYTAHPALPAMLVQNLKDLTDKAGKPLGQEMLDVAREGEIAEVSYLWPRPGTETPVAKGMYVARVGDQVCGVRYYR